MTARAGATEVATDGNDTQVQMRAKPEDLEFPYPPCSLCGETTYHDGDGFCCEHCGAAWDGGGQNGSYEKEEPACQAYIKWFNHKGLEVRFENIRHQTWQCSLADGHEGEHRHFDSTWTDEDPRVVPRPTDETRLM